MARSKHRTLVRHAQAPAISILERERRKFAGDPNAFLEFAFSESGPYRQSAVHRELQHFLTRHRKALIELPRDHGKTTQICGRVLWELGRNPALRIKFVCATEMIAGDRGRFLRDAIGGNPRLSIVFPQLVRSEPWTVEAFSVSRPAGVLGPSVASFGIGSGSTGTRADLLICDDIVDVRGLFSRAERERVKLDFHNNLLNLLEPDGRFWGLSTPWHADDLNAHLKRNAAFELFRRAVGTDLEPVWPERWPREALAERRAEIGAAAFDRAYRLLPVAEGDVVIREDWLQGYSKSPDCWETILLAIDPALSTRSTADATALVVLGRSEGRVYLLAAEAHRVAVPELIPLIEECDRRWHPAIILFESNAAFQGISDLLKRHPSFGSRIQDVKQSRSKPSRIGAFGATIRDGTVLLPRIGTGFDPAVQPLIDEMLAFPYGDNDDLVDAAAFGTAYLHGHRDPNFWLF